MFLMKTLEKCTCAQHAASTRQKAKSDISRVQQVKQLRFKKNYLGEEAQRLVRSN